MKISFVIPAYNEQEYIGLCLDSINRQLPNASCEVEIIVVNNASTDRTTQVAQSFQNVSIVDEPRKGLTYARQAGFLAASGDLIANVDADSVLTPGWIETVVHEFSANPKLVALSGPFIFYDLSPTANLFVRLWYRVAYISYAINRFILRLSSMLQGGNFVIRRAALKKIGGFNTTFNFYGEDTEIARRLHTLGPVKFTFALPMYSSARRLKHEGFVTTAWHYGINYFWTIFFNKPFTKQYVDVRNYPGKA